MKPTLMIALAVLALSAGGAAAETMTTVSCENAEVTIGEQQTAEIKAVTGEENFGKEVCAVASKIDASALTEPTDVDVTMSTGKVYSVKLQAKQ